MKEILITGVNSYIGTSFKKWLAQWPDKYEVDTIDMVDSSWKEKDFSGYDTVYHVAGIAHNDTGKADDKKKSLYYKVNTDLAIETAKKAKADGVKQFIMMSSIIVYGASAKIGQIKVINRDTEPAPISFYGDSKLRAEQGILSLQDENFNVVILRTPMVYGKGSKGNYPILVKYALKLPFFPDIDNQRSMIYIENLMEFVKLMVDNNESGIFYPQNKEYVKTSDMVRLVAEAHGKKINMTKLFNPAIKLFKNNTILQKVFGNLCYDLDISRYKQKYELNDFKSSIYRTENIQ